MSRIRSVHPGLYSDEAFMEASMAARVVMIGLWNEADDQGLFEWKPIRLKARLLPADSIDMIAILTELEGLNVIRSFEHGGKRFGAVRNFRKYQRPQRPTAQHPLPEWAASYVGLSASPHGGLSEGSRSDHGIAQQMEEEGGRMEEKDSGAFVPNGTTAPRADHPTSPPEPSAPEPASVKDLAPPDPPQPKKPAVLDRQDTPPPDGDDEAADPEGWFWAQATALEARGVARSRMANLASLHQGNWRVLNPIVRDILAAKVPSAFLGRIVSNLKTELDTAPPSARPEPRRGRDRGGGEPDFVRAARAEGQFVVVGTRSNGRPSYKIATTIYDEAGAEIGF